MNPIKQIRAHLQLSQAQLAHEVHISASLISHYETGRRHPSIKTAKNIIKFAQKSGLKYSLDYIYS